MMYKTVKYSTKWNLDKILKIITMNDEQKNKLKEYVVVMMKKEMTKKITSILLASPGIPQCNCMVKGSSEDF